jgi:hypothetical protein
VFRVLDVSIDGPNVSVFQHMLYAQRRKFSNCMPEKNLSRTNSTNSHESQDDSCCSLKTNASGRTNASGKTISSGMNSNAGWKSNSSFVDHGKHIPASIQKNVLLEVLYSGAKEERIRLISYQSGYYQPYAWYNPLRYLYRQRRKDRIDGMLSRNLTLSSHLAANHHESFK